MQRFLAVVLLVGLSCVGGGRAAAGPGEGALDGKDPWPVPPDAANDSPAGLLYCARYDRAPYCAYWLLVVDPYARARVELEAGAHSADLAAGEIPDLGPEYQDPHAAAVALSEGLELLNHAATLLPAP